MMVRNLFPGGNQTPTQFAEKVAFSEKVSSCWVCVGFWVRFFPNIFPTFFQGTLFSQHFPNIFPTKYGFGTVYVFLGYPQNPTKPNILLEKRWVQSTLFCVLLRSPILWCTRLCTGLGKVPLNSENPAALIVFPDPNRTPTPRFCTQKTRKNHKDRNFCPPGLTGRV